MQTQVAAEGTGTAIAYQTQTAVTAATLTAAPRTASGNQVISRQNVNASKR